MRYTSDDEEPQPLTASQREELEEKARNIVLNSLSASSKSRAQLEEKLAKKNMPDDIVLSVLDRFTEVGLVDDKAYAQGWVQGRHTSRGMARSAIKMELRRKGVSNEDAEEALALLDDEMETTRAYELVRSKLRSTGHLDRDARTRRLVSLLARRGYSPGTAYTVVRNVLDEVTTQE